MSGDVTGGPAADRTRAPRPGEELDTGALARYLREHLEDAGDDLAGEDALVVEQFPAGYSNLTYLLKLGERELVLRRPPFGSRVETAHDMAREFRVLSGLQGVYPAAPRPFLLCEDAGVLDAPFYVMERRRGLILRRALPPGFALDAELAGRLCASFVDQLADLHLLDWRAAGLAELDRGEGYVRRQVDGWTRRYAAARTDDWRELESVAAWLAEHQPEDSGKSLIHNDFKYDNLVLDADDPTRVVAVLDWEMCTVGDPLMDLGSSLAYWIEPGDPEPLRATAFGPTAVPGSWSRRELVARYAERTGFDAGGAASVVFYFAFGLFKLAVIAQQIYRRYAEGHTRDPRFAGMNQMVGLLGRVAAGAVERDAI